MSARSPRPAAADIGLRWHHGLQFRLACLFVGLLAVLAAVGVYVADRLIGDGMSQASDRYAASVNRRLVTETRNVLRVAERAAEALARLPPGHDAALTAALGETLLAGLPVASFAIWPEPASTAPGAVPAVQYWRIVSGGRAQARNDRAVTGTAWWREPWYTPARLTADIARGCLWSAPYRDAGSGRDVVTCTVAITRQGAFDGVATVSLDLQALDQTLLALDPEPRSYALLADRHGRVLAMSALARSTFAGTASGAITLDQLAAQAPDYAAIATERSARDRAFRAAALHSARYDARRVSSLKDNTRGLDRDAAEDLLAAVWNHVDGAPAAAATPLTIARDPVLGEAGDALLAAVPGSDWLLLSVAPVRDGRDASIHLTRQVLLLSIGGSALVLLLSFVLLRQTVIRPLRAMGAALADTALDGRAPTLDESGAGELRQIAHWHNERSERVAELRDRVDVVTNQLHVENSERLRAQDALLRQSERLRLLVDSVDEGLVVLDANGVVDDLNGTAERWLSGDSAALRGRPFASLLDARLGSADGPPLPDLWRQIEDRGTRIDYPDGVVLLQPLGPSRALGLSAIPLRSRIGRLNGAVIVLRQASAPRDETAGDAARRDAADTAATDPVTGLGNRAACERQLRERLGAARADASAANTALAKLQFRELGRVRESGTAGDADALAARCGDRLAALAGGSDRVFRLGPDRFGVLIDAASDDDAVQQAEALRLQIAEQPLLVGEHWRALQPTVGLCRVSADVESPAELLRRAGLACDHARDGASALLYGPALESRQSIDEERLWVRRIERGLEHRLFHLTTQSVQPARSHANDGEVFDVLLSLEDEEGFWAPMGTFLPVAERHRLGAQLDQWTIRALFERLAAQPDLGTRLAFCTVPLSADALGDASLIDVIAEGINRHPQLPIDKLCFLLRDDTLSAQPQLAQRCVDGLRALGARVAIDHRGGRQIGYIDLLRRLQVGLLRIDASAFARIVDDQVEQMLADTLIRLARLGSARTLITEIDSEAQATVWRRLGADYLQGNAIARPSPVPFRN